MSLTIYTVVRLVLAIDNTGWFIAYSSPEILDAYLPWTHLVQKVCREKENKEPEL